MRRSLLTPIAVLGALFLGSGVVPAAATVDSVDPVYMTLDAYGFAFPGPPPGSQAGCGNYLPACPVSLPQSAYALQTGDGTSANAVATITSFPAILVSAVGVYNPPEGEPSITTEAEASGELKFYFELFPVPSTDYVGSVPVLMVGSSTISFTTPVGGTASSTVSMCVATGDSPCIYSLPDNNNGQFLQTLSIDPGQEYYVDMTADASVEGSGSAKATIDPFLSISSTCNCANDFQLVLSSGITNGVSAIPEPATWGMMLIGFAGLGLAARYRMKGDKASLTERQAFSLLPTLPFGTSS